MKKKKKFDRNGVVETGKRPNPVRSSSDDIINSPSHYKQGEMEAITAIEGLGLGFHAGNVVKYLARYRWKHRDKDGGVQDLRKAAWYLQRLIDRECRHGSGEVKESGD